MAIASGSYTIGGTSPDYATIQLWEDDFATTLTGVVEGKCRAATFNESVTMGGVTSTASAYPLLTFDTGAFHAMDLRGGVQMRGPSENTSDAHCILVQQRYTRIVGLNFNRWHGVSSEGIRVDERDVRIERCLFWGANNINADGVFIGGGTRFQSTHTTDTVYISNCVFLGLGRTAIHVQGDKSGIAYVYKCVAAYNSMANQNTTNDDVRSYVGIGDDLGDPPTTNGFTWHIKSTYSHCWADPNSVAAPAFGKGSASSWGSSTKNASSDSTAPGTSPQTSAAVANQFTETGVEYRVGENTADDYDPGIWYDAKINSGAPTTNYGGAALALDNSPIINTLFRIPLSGVSNTHRVLATALCAKRSSTSGSNQTFGWYRLLRAWVEGQVTYNVYSTGNSWATAGATGTGDIEANCSDGGTTVKRSSAFETSSVTSNGDIDNGEWFRWSAGKFVDWVQDAIDGNAPGANANDFEVITRWYSQSYLHDFYSTEAADGSKPFLQYWYDTSTNPIDLEPVSGGVLDGNGDDLSADGNYPVTIDILGNDAGDDIGVIVFAPAQTGTAGLASAALAARGATGTSAITTTAGLASAAFAVKHVADEIVFANTGAEDAVDAPWSSGASMTQETGQSPPEGSYVFESIGQGVTHEWRGPNANTASDAFFNLFLDKHSEQDLHRVDPLAEYAGSVWARRTVNNGGTFYAGFVMWKKLDPSDFGYTEDRRFVQIYPRHVHAIGSDHATTGTTLAADVNPSDTTITLTDGSGWLSQNNTYIAFNCQTDGSDIPNLECLGIASVSGNVVTLDNPVPAGISFSSGNVVRQMRDGATFNYSIAITSLDGTWTQYGPDYTVAGTGTYVSGFEDVLQESPHTNYPEWRVGTTHISPLVLPMNGAGAPGDTVQWDDFTVYRRRSTYATPGAVTGTAGLASAAFAALGDTGSTTTPTASREHFRLRNDDGSETAATWLEAEDNGTTQLAPGDAFRLRETIDADDGRLEGEIFQVVWRPGRVNLLQYSEQLDRIPGTWSNNGNGLLVTANNAVAPWGGTIAETLEQTATAAVNRSLRQYFTAQVSGADPAGKTFRYSIWAKKISGSDTTPTFQLNMIQTGDFPTETFSGDLGLTGSWQRFDYSFTAGASATAIRFAIDVGFPTDGSAHDNVIGVFGAMVTETGFLTPYQKIEVTEDTTWIHAEF
jgi:hypothetical protein